MKRAKDKYMINRTKYKDIKRYDHQQMEDFLTDVYKNGYADGKESVTGVELQDVEKALQDVKGIGPVVWNRIKERLAELFRKEQCHESTNHYTAMGDTDRKRSQNERNEILENQLSRGSFNPRREEPEGLYKRMLH